MREVNIDATRMKVIFTNIGAGWSVKKVFVNTVIDGGSFLNLVILIF